MGEDTPRYRVEGHDWAFLLPPGILPPRPSPRFAEPGRFPMLEAALAVVQQDVDATWRGTAPRLRLLIASFSTEDDLRLGVALENGECAAEPLDAVDFEQQGDDDTAMDAIEGVADAAQETLMELFMSVWPSCPQHDFGLHAGEMIWPASERRTEYRGAWWCNGDGGHRVAAIGELSRGAHPQARSG